MRYNGALIDCSRLLERHEFYYRLVDFMAEWKMNLLLFHFSDDHGLGVKLPGFSELAVKHAFTAAAARKLSAYAEKKGIEFVPEVETFGHIRFLTDNPKYARLLAGKRSRNLSFNALDPLNPESLRVVERLLRATCRVFPGRYLHIGCDEVNLEEYCRARPGLEQERVWAEYAGKVIGFAKRLGREPLFWADHPAKNARIAELLRKDATAVWWNYRPEPPNQEARTLRKAGFKKLFVAPATASFNYRSLPTLAALDNNDRMAACAKKYRARGFLNTVWCPWRYVQETVFYGLAYGAESCRSGGRLDRDKFNAKFVARVFGVKSAPEAARCLRLWPEIELTWTMTRAVYSGDLRVGPEFRARFARANAAWRESRKLAADFSPRRNADIWQALRLAADAAGLCTEYFRLASGKASAARKAEYNALLCRTRAALSRNWDRTRYPDDPHKRRAKFLNEAPQYLLLLLKKLPRFKT